MTLVTARGVFALSLMIYVSSVLADIQSVKIRGQLRVFDGDTLEFGPMLIRQHGVDAPEKSQNCIAKSGGNWRCGAASSSYLAEQIDGKEITCDALDRDPYGQIISRCAANGTDIGAVLIENGLAWAFVEHSDDYTASEVAARSQHIGVWQADTQTPWAFRDDKWNRA